jgi:hypothetical protein
LQEKTTPQEEQLPENLNSPHLSISDDESSCESAYNSDENAPCTITLIMNPKKKPIINTQEDIEDVEMKAPPTEVVETLPIETTSSLTLENSSIHVKTSEDVEMRDQVQQIHQQQVQQQIHQQVLRLVPEVPRQDLRVVLMEQEEEEVQVQNPLRDSSHDPLPVLCNKKEEPTSTFKTSFQTSFIPTTDKDMEEFSVAMDDGDFQNIDLHPSNYFNASH